MRSVRKITKAHSELKRRLEKLKLAFYRQPQAEQDARSVEYAEFVRVPPILRPGLQKKLVA